MDADELARVVSEAARKGSVAAMKLRHEQLEPRTHLSTSPPTSLRAKAIRAARGG